MSIPNYHELIGKFEEHERKQYLMVDDYMLNKVSKVIESKWSNLRQLKKKKKIIKIKILLLSIARKNKLSLLYTISKFNYPRIVRKTEILLSELAVIYYMLYNNFFYIRLVFIFDLQKAFYCVHNNTDTFFCFLL